MKRIAILASGEGTNAENIIQYFKDSEEYQVRLVITNKASAGALVRARAQGVPCVYFSAPLWKTGSSILSFLKAEEIDFVVLAGFLTYVPDCVLKFYNRRMVNIHPSLLPRHCGKGMYGDKVHESVLSSGDKESGITIHYTTLEYDAGEIISQVKCEVKDTDNVLSLASRVHSLEYYHYPRVIEQLLREL